MASKRKQQDQTRPRLIIVESGNKGGTGKSLTALALTELAYINDIEFGVVQIDDQRRLEATLDRQLISVDIDVIRKARKDPSAVIHAFGPAYEAIAALRGTKKWVIVDIGATQQNLLYTYAQLTDLDPDLQEFGIATTVFLVCLSDQESMLQCLRSRQVLRDVLPSAQCVLMLNHRDGAHDQLPRSSEAGRVYCEQLKPVLIDLPSVVMPKIEGGTWQVFERNHIRPLQVLSMSLEELMQLTGLSRPEAKVARGDVAEWFASMQDGVGGLLGLADHD